jgi:hypothetical protein
VLAHLLSVVKVQIAEEHPSVAIQAAEKALLSGETRENPSAGAKAHRLLSAIYGTLRLRSGQALKSCPFNTRLSLWAANEEEKLVPERPHVAGVRFLNASRNR